MADQQYDRMPLDQLPIDRVERTDPAHLRRSERYPNEEDITLNMPPTRRRPGATHRT